MAAADLRQPIRWGKWPGISFIAFLSMLGIAAVMAAVKWNQPEFRSPGISSPFEAIGLFVLFMAIPLFGQIWIITVAMGLLDRWLKGRLTLTGNAVLGGGLGALDALGYLAIGQAVPGSTPMNAASITAFVPILAVGGVVLSIGMRRRDRP